MGRRKAVKNIVPDTNTITQEDNTNPIQVVIVENPNLQQNNTSTEPTTQC